MKYFLLAVAYLLLNGQAWALTIHDLLDAAARQPGFEIKTLAAQESSLGQEAATAALFPKFGLFGRAEAYNSPTNLLPVTPTDAAGAAFGEPVPFSREILRYGLTFEAPVYIRELYVLRQKAAILTEKAQMDRRFDLVGRQAGVISLNSSLTYLEYLGKAIDGRRASLGKTYDDMELKVRIGRSPESELLKIAASVNDLDQQRNELTAKRLDVLRDLKTLTGLDLSEPAPMALSAKPAAAPYLQAEAQQKEVDAAQKELERRQAARYPTLSVSAFLSGNDGEAYNTDSHIDRSYNAVALVLKFPLFDRTLTTDESIAHVQWQKAKKRLEETQIELGALADNLDRKLPVVEQSIDLAKKSITDNETLLAVAQVAVRSGRMTMEDYLRYESNVLAAQAALYQAQQLRWQILAQQAVLYGTDLGGVVR